MKRINMSINITDSYTRVDDYSIEWQKTITEQSISNLTTNMMMIMTAE